MYLRMTSCTKRTSHITDNPISHKILYWRIQANHSIYNQVSKRVVQESFEKTIRSVISFFPLKKIGILKGRQEKRRHKIKEI